MKKFLIFSVLLVGCVTVRAPQKSDECRTLEMVALWRIQKTLDRLDERTAPKYGDFEIGKAGARWVAEPGSGVGTVAAKGHLGAQLLPGAVNATPSAMPLHGVGFSGSGVQ